MDLALTMIGRVSKIGWVGSRYIEMVKDILHLLFGVVYMLKQRLEKIAKFSVLFFYVIIFCYKMYFKSCGSYRDLSSSMKRKGLAPIIKESEASKIFFSITCKERKMANDN